MAHEKAITGAVGLGGQVYRAGQEATFDEALKTDAGKTVDLDRLEASGHLKGYGSAKAAKAAAEPAPAPAKATKKPAKGK